MRQKDVTVIVMVAVVAALIGYFVSNILLASPNSLQTTVEDVPVISPEFREVDTRYFNIEAENPTQLIEIQDNDNKNPFPIRTEQN